MNAAVVEADRCPNLAMMKRQCDAGKVLWRWASFGWG